MLSKELIATSTIPVVLSILAKGDTYGYALIQKVREISDERIVWTEGMLYPILHWIKHKNMIESEWRKEDDKRQRKYYRLRKEGRKALREEQEQWMTVHETLTSLWKTKLRLT